MTLFHVAIDTTPIDVAALPGLPCPLQAGPAFIVETAGTGYRPNEGVDEELITPNLVLDRVPVRANCRRVLQRPDGHRRRLRPVPVELSGFNAR